MFTFFVAIFLNINFKISQIKYNTKSIYLSLEKLKKTLKGQKREIVFFGYLMLSR